ncbi:Maelstrom domain-containing protein [Entamoeba marina]
MKTHFGGNSKSKSSINYHINIYTPNANLLPVQQSKFSHSNSSKRKYSSKQIKPISSDDDLVKQKKLLPQHILEEKILKKQQQKKRIAELKNQEKQAIDQNIYFRLLHHYNKILFHFYDFEYASQTRDDIYPIEMGISSHYINNWECTKQLHTLIHPGPYQPQFKYTQRIHGIPCNSMLLRSDYHTIAIELNNYLKSELPIVMVSKEDKPSGDMKCIETLFKKGNVTMPDILFITHTQLVNFMSKVLCKNISNPTNILNSVFQKLNCAEVCNFHQQQNKTYHCALNDAHHTAMMIYLYFKKYLGCEIENMTTTFPDTIFAMEKKTQQQVI